MNRRVKRGRDILCFSATAVLLILFFSPLQRLEAHASQAGKSSFSDVVDQITETAGDLYEQMDEALENMDGESLRGQIRAALEQMDAMGISPTAFARDRLGIRLNPTNGIATGITGDLVESAERVVREESQGPLQDLFDTILGMISDFFGDVASLIGEHVSLPFSQ